VITAVDTNILLDILIPDKANLLSSKKMLDEYTLKGQLIICELVYAELASQFAENHALQAFLSDTGIKLVPSGEKVLNLAGKTWKEYAGKKKIGLQCHTCGKAVHVTCPSCKAAVTARQHIISDFIIGAHALVFAELLLSRDRGFYRTYFRNLRIAQQVTVEY
jgi:predicted nucleic acid-binding protein